MIVNGTGLWNNAHRSFLILFCETETLKQNKNCVRRIEREQTLKFYCTSSTMYEGLHRTDRVKLSKIVEHFNWTCVTNSRLLTRRRLLTWTDFERCNVLVDGFESVRVLVLRAKPLQLSLFVGVSRYASSQQLWLFFGGWGRHSNWLEHTCRAWKMENSVTKSNTSSSDFGWKPFSRFVVKHWDVNQDLAYLVDFAMLFHWRRQQVNFAQEVTWIGKVETETHCLQNLKRVWNQKQQTETKYLSLSFKQVFDGTKTAAHLKGRTSQIPGFKLNPHRQSHARSGSRSLRTSMLPRCTPIQ